jgi:hypothetical protein
MLAEMFFISGDYSQALLEYQVSLTSDPNRFNALLGACQAAEGYFEVTPRSKTSADTACVVRGHGREEVRNRCSFTSAATKARVY